MSPGRGWIRDQSGQVGGIEAVAFGMLVLVVGVLMVANAWGVVDAKFSAGTAAQQAARAYAKAPEAVDPLALATDAGLRALGGHARGAQVDLVAGSFTRCSPVTFRVSVPVRFVLLPWLGTTARVFTVVGRGSDIVDPYRSGLVGTGTGGSADCGASP